MSRSLTYRAISMILALLVAISSTGMNLQLHYCQGHFAGIDLFADSGGCSQKIGKKSCSKRADTNDSKKNCCENEQVSLDILDHEVITSWINLDVDLDHIFTNSLSLHSDITIESPSVINWTDFHPPPRYNQSIFILFDSFLI